MRSSFGEGHPQTTGTACSAAKAVTLVSSSDKQGKLYLFSRFSHQPTRPGAVWFPILFFLLPDKDHHCLPAIDLHNSLNLQKHKSTDCLRSHHRHSLPIYRKRRSLVVLALKKYSNAYSCRVSMAKFHEQKRAIFATQNKSMQPQPVAHSTGRPECITKYICINLHLQDEKTARRGNPIFHNMSGFCTSVRNPYHLDMSCKCEEVHMPPSN